MEWSSEKWVIGTLVESFVGAWLAESILEEGETKQFSGD